MLISGSADNNRVFPKVDHSGNDARIVLEQNKFSKNVTSNRYCTLDLKIVVHTSCATVSCLANCANSHCLKDWDYNYPYIVILYWFQLNPLYCPKVNWCTNKSGVKDPPQLTVAKIAQMVRHEPVNTSEHYSHRGKGSVPARPKLFAEFILL